MERKMRKINEDTVVSYNTDGSDFNAIELAVWAYNQLAAAPELLATLTHIASREKKSMLADCAYQGPPPKTWIKEMEPYYRGYSKCLEEIQEIVRVQLAEIKAKGES